MYTVRTFFSFIDLITLQSDAKIGVVWYHTYPAYAPEALTVMNCPQSYIHHDYKDLFVPLQ